MTPSIIPFHDLRPGVHALTDASSISEIERTASTLTTRLDPASARTVLNDVDGFALGPSLSLLERWIVVDHVVADLIAVDSLDTSSDSLVRSFRYEPSEYDLLYGGAQLPSHREEAFLSHVRTGISAKGRSGQDNWPLLGNMAERLSLSLTLIPAEVFKKCSDVLGRTSQAIQTAHPDVSWRSFGFGLEKRYGEVLVEFYGKASFLARSNVGVERTLVYYETAAAAGVPLILHPHRYEEAKAIDLACCDAYASVRELLRTAFEDPIRSQLESLGQTHTVTVPPLVTQLIQIAGTQQVSIVDAAIEIKDSKNARSFRKWLSDLQQCLAARTIGGGVEALRILDELRRVASLWVAHLDVTVGVTHKKREFRLSWIPRVGALLDLLDKPTLRDPILNQKGYLNFLSSWYGKT
jgi:hypothetical protein